MMASAATWVNLNVIILSKDSQTKRNILRYLLYVGSKRMIQMHLFTKTETIYKNKNVFSPCLLPAELRDSCLFSSLITVC